MDGLIQAALRVIGKLEQTSIVLRQVGLLALSVVGLAERYIMLTLPRPLAMVLRHYSGSASPAYSLVLPESVARPLSLSKNEGVGL